MIPLSQEIKKEALRLGYVRVGIIPAKAFNEYGKYLEERVNSFPGSVELYKKMYNRITPPEEGKSIIVCIWGYNRYRMPDSLKGMIGKYYIFDDRLEYSEGYKARNEFKDFLLSKNMSLIRSDIPSRWAAAKAGTGFFGANNFIYSDCGSYCSIHHWVVDTELEYDNPEYSGTVKRICGEHCRKCIDACPTGALNGDFSMDMGKCIAQLSFHVKELPPKELWDKMGTWVYGCDACQDVCPMNAKKLNEKEDCSLPDYPKLNLDEHLKYLTLENILNMTEETYRTIIQPRFWYISPDDIWLWRCNALRAMINSGDKKYNEIIKKHCGDSDERVKMLAVWGCEKINAAESKT